MFCCCPRQERIDAWKAIDTLKSPSTSASTKKPKTYTYRDLYDEETGEGRYGTDEDGNPLDPEGNPVYDDGYVDPEPDAAFEF